TAPFSHTRPSLISRSESRRDATPARAINFAILSFSTPLAWELSRAIRLRAPAERRYGSRSEMESAARPPQPHIWIPGDTNSGLKEMLPEEQSAGVLRGTKRWYGSRDAPARKTGRNSQPI